MLNRVEEFEVLYQEKLYPVAKTIPKAKSGAQENFFSWCFSVAPVVTSIAFAGGVAAILAFSLITPGKGGRRPIISYGDAGFMPAVLVLIIGALVWFLAYGALQIHRARFNEELQEAQKRRADIMTQVGAFFGLQYMPGPLFTPQDLIAAGLTGYEETEYTILENTLAGAPSGAALEIVEAYFQTGRTKNGPIMRRGILALYHLNKRFEGTTILYEDSLMRKMGQALTSTMTRVKLEWPLFEKAFDLYTTSQVDARIVMDTDFMEAVYEFYQKFGLRNLFISFYNNKMLVFLPKDNWPYETGFNNHAAAFYQDMDFLINLPAHLRFKSFMPERFLDRSAVEARRQLPAAAPPDTPRQPSALPGDITPLVDAIIAGNMEQAENILRSDLASYYLNRPLALNGNTPLHIVVWNGHRDIVRLLLNTRGIDRFAKNHSGKTALDLARENGLADIEELLAAAP